MIFAGVVIGLGASLDDRVEVEVGDGADEGYVEGLCTQAIADDSNVEFAACHSEQGRLVAG